MTRASIISFDPRGVRAPLGAFPFAHKFDPATTLWRPEQLLQKVTEAQVVDTAVRSMENLGIWVKVVDVGAKVVRGRAIAALKKSGVKNPEILLRPSHAGGKTDGDPGFSDLTGIVTRGPFRGRPFYFEAKRPPRYRQPAKLGGALAIQDRAGELTDEQLGFLLDARLAGAIVGVFWHPHEPLHVLRLIGG